MLRNLGEEKPLTIVERAEKGEHITPKVAKDILARERKKPTRKKRAAQDLTEKLAKALGRFRDRWNQKELSGLARRVREFADAQEKEGAQAEEGGADAGRRSTAGSRESAAKHDTPSSVERGERRWRSGVTAPTSAAAGLSELKISLWPARQLLQIVSLPPPSRAVFLC
jgi:hypothetical protein